MPSPNDFPIRVGGEYRDSAVSNVLRHVVFIGAGMVFAVSQVDGYIPGHSVSSWSIDQFRSCHLSGDVSAMGKAVDALESQQWARDGYCLECGFHEGMRHKGDCSIGSALSAIKKVTMFATNHWAEMVAERLEGR